jgi:hypothetical protein
MTTHPHQVPRSTMSRSSTSSHPKCLRGVLWGCFNFSIQTYVRNILGYFSASRQPVTIFCIEINNNFNFDLRILTLWTVFVERITFVNRRMGVQKKSLIFYCEMELEWGRYQYQYEWAYKVPHASRPFSDLLCVPICFIPQVVPYFW